MRRTDAVPNKRLTDQRAVSAECGRQSLRDSASSGRSLEDEKTSASQLFFAGPLPRGGR